ncbi:MAG: Rne/Rng family ribonuclease, partial [Bryobacterales bacterium]|nr:Rne/Rng family ribonuclease [Bryobacterales bacterium]
MSKELVISSNRHETKLAVLEDDQLVEIFFQRSEEYSLVGSIHKGRVTRVLPGMQSAFVELGLERDAFLYVSDFLEQTGEDYERVTAGEEPAAAAAPRQGGGRDRGGRDRDRGDRRGDRNRDRDRDREARGAASVSATPAPVAEALPRAEATADAESEETAVSGETAAAAEGMEPAAAVAEVQAEGASQADEQQPRGEQTGERGDRGDRRGGRRRRRRRGGRGPAPSGLPDSKFASPTEAAAGDDDASDEEDDAPETAAAAAPAAPVFTYGGPVAPARAAASREEGELPPIVLPGESIAKYRREEREPAPAAARPAFVAPPSPPPPPPLPAAVEAPAVELVAEPVAAEEEAEVRDLVAEHIELHQAAIAAEAEEADTTEEPTVIEVELEDGADAAAEIDTEAEAEADSEADSENEAEEESDEDDVDALQAAAEAAIASGSPLPESGSAEVREDQPAARFVQRRERGDRGGRRRGGRDRDRDRGGDRNRSGGGERYESVPRAAAAAGADGQAVAEAKEGRPDRPERERRERPPLPSISDLLKEGQEIIVQIYKEPLGTKGARITSHVAMPGRYVVFMPTADHHGVSRKLGNDEERQRLKRIVQANSQGMVGGFIVRTAGEGKSEADIAADMGHLYNQWLDIRKKAEKRRAPCLLHSDLELVTRTLRDQVNDSFRAIWTDNEDMYEMVVSFLELFQPALVPRVKMYSRDTPIFDTFNITAELEKALRPKVWLKSGGYIVINQTEALVAIDINTGKYVGKSNRLEDTIVKTNIEAVKEIVRQIRLRDLGGIIVVDFIDMEERKNRQKV